jgi:threonine/homoserine/homoserine lactone efflux protein
MPNAPGRPVSPGGGNIVVFQAIGAGLPAALAIALSPFPVIGIVLILSGSHGRVNGPFFAAGWIVGLSVVTALVVVVFSGADDPDSTSSAIAGWARVLAGAALVALGVRKWWTRPRDGDDRDVPGWMASLDSATSGKAVVLGLALSGANPKNFVLAAAAATTMVEVGLHGTDLAVAVVVFVLVGSLTVVGAVVLSFVGGTRGAALLDDVRVFMIDNSTAITIVIMLILGVKVLGDGLTGLGQ